MSDLISRSQLLKEIETWGGCVEALHEYIQNMPTAYNIDKVVEELGQKKEEVQRMRNTCVALSDLEVCDIENVTYERAIEIVKQGFFTSKEAANIKYDYVDYELKSGDSIYTIGKKHGQQIDLTGSWIDIFKEANHIVNIKTFDEIFKPGNIVKVPIWREKDE